MQTCVKVCNAGCIGRFEGLTSDRLNHGDEIADTMFQLLRDKITPDAGAY